MKFLSSFIGRAKFCGGYAQCAPFTEVVPKNVARVEDDRSEQPQIGIPSQLLKRRGVRRQEAAPSEPQQKPLQSVTLLCGGKAPPCRRCIIARRRRWSV